MVACETCAYWQKPRSYPADREVEAFDRPPVTQGQCRRYPPFMSRNTQGSNRAQWPLTLATHWCGEHAIEEEP